MLAAIVFTVYFGAVQWRMSGHALKLVLGGGQSRGPAGAPGEVSHFQALATALSGTLGLGNIAGVAVGLSIGGPGATFWMIVAGLLGMASKFVECTLGVRFRRSNPDGSVSGGPMYYLSRGLAQQGRPLLGRALAATFAVLCIGGAIGGGNMFQANQAFRQVVAATGGDASALADRGWLFGLVAALLVGIVVIGGIRSIAAVADKLVPLMTLLYLVACAIVLALHADRLGEALHTIVAGAFTGEGVAGGALGALIQGFRRAAFSNEAGVGTSAIAHAAVRTRHPVTEGYVAMLEPFIDTVVVCTMTALVIVASGALASGADGVALTSVAFSGSIPGFTGVLALIVCLFAYSTTIAWAYYGLKCWTYLVGEGRRRSLGFHFVYCSFVVVGASMELAPVIAFADAMTFAMAVPNILGLYLLMPLVRQEERDYRAALGKAPPRSWRTDLPRR